MGINPRFIRDEKFEDLKKSILRDSDYMLNRPILVNRTQDGLFIYAGTQRHKACVDLGWSEVPCFIEDDLPEDIIKRRMILDNVHSGRWDDDKLLDFDKGDLTFLDLSLEGLDFTYKDPIVQDKPKREEDANTEAILIHGELIRNTAFGKHEFSYVFANDMDKGAFAMALSNLPVKQDQRPEDFISQRLKEIYH